MVVFKRRNGHVYAKSSDCFRYAHPYNEVAIWRQKVNRDEFRPTMGSGRPRNTRERVRITMPKQIVRLPFMIKLNPLVYYRW